VRLTLVGELRRALDERELTLHYQPKARLADGSVGTVEALLRWNHPSAGSCCPGEFIPTCQQTGLIEPLSRYVVDTALRQCRAWLDAGLRLAVSVNLAPRNLTGAEFPAVVEALLAEHGVDGTLLEIELTESAMLADAVALARRSSGSRRSAPASRSMTSAPATSRSPSCATCRSARSSSTARCCAMT
jgi:EAL domain-containing protein (putative c-di-GMP-specific phosphodiesterase class I)